MKYTLIITTMYGGESASEFEGSPSLIEDFVDKASAIDNLLLPWRIEDDHGNIVARGKIDNFGELQIEFRNGTHAIRKGSVVELCHGYPEAFQMRVDRFQDGFVILKDLDKSQGFREDEGEIWNLPSDFESGWFVRI